MTHKLLQITVYDRPGGRRSIALAQEMDLLVRRSNRGFWVTGFLINSGYARRASANMDIRARALVKTQIPKLCAGTPLVMN